MASRRRGERDPDAGCGGPADRRVERKDAVDRREAFDDPVQATERPDHGATGSIIGDHDGQCIQAVCIQAVVCGDAQHGGSGVFERIGDKLHRAVVGDALDRGRQSVGQMQVEVDRDGQRAGEGAQRGFEAAVDIDRMSAARDLADAGEGPPGQVVGGAQQVDRRWVGVLALSHPVNCVSELERYGRQLCLGAIVQVAFQAAQPLVCILDAGLPGEFELVNAVLGSRRT